MADMQFQGLHHLALVCSDMERTVKFYTEVLGMKLKKGFDLDGGYGQHFFFDMGAATSLRSSGSTMRRRNSRASLRPIPSSAGAPATSRPPTDR